LIGFVKDYTKNYAMAFVIGGAMIMIAAYFHIAIVCVKPERTEEAENEENNDV
jgi:hypothetical protein